ncbi:MAG TPA: protein kinase, partial [Polyangiaceae bacterium]|nr:protein kinase [Polyangiaceae bacterium]
EQSMGGTKRKVAVKVLLSEYSGRDQDMQRFERECATVVELEHPNTIKFHDYGETPEGDMYIAMELLVGPSLSQVLRDGPLSPERVDLIMGQICGSLQEAHDRGIVHRDVKPDNVIITSPGGAPDFVKVLDFGIAKRVGGRDPKLTPLGVVLGSPPYMSPEQFTLQDIDARSDIYSLGVVAYQMLTGRLPFEAKDPMEWAALHMGAEPAPIDTPGFYIPDSMRQAIARALSKYPADRPQSMRELYSSFTLGTGTLPPGRASSVLPRSPSEWPRPSQMLSDVPSKLAELPKAPRAPSVGGLGGAPARARDATTQQELAEEAVPKHAALAPPPMQAPRAGAALPLRSISDEPTHESTPFETSSPDLSFHESELSLPVPSSADEPATRVRDASSADEPPTRMRETSAQPPKAGKGTLVMPASEPPPPVPAAAPSRPRLTMPDLLPPTVRDGSAGVATRRGRGRVLLFVGVALAFVGAVTTALVWIFVLRETTPRVERDRASTGSRAGTLTAPSAKIDVPPDPTAPPRAPSATPTAEPSAERLSPCQTAVFSAVSGQCEGARKAYARCSEESPYRPSAERAMKGLCP